MSVGPRDLNKLADLFAMARYAHADIREALQIVFEADDARRRRAAGGFAKAHEHLRRLSKPMSGRLKRAAARLFPIVAEVAAYHSLPVDRLMGPKRDRETCRIRDEAVWRCRHETFESYPVVAAAVGCINHTSAIAAVKRFEKRMAADSKLRARVLGIAAVRSVA